MTMLIALGIVFTVAVAVAVWMAGLAQTRRMGRELAELKRRRR